ncbi:Uncharacterized protein DBV15_09753 [Temnothorax longispinosus]|uniref:Uncharacterized protein n=1 Tax=Temnothorax longispinosus TaxID=300112 RepID=A0A4S2L0Z4_9HYME|nr:Uncharacterized protein DBV15_09753 [Temnothorax longispinosus]
MSGAPARGTVPRRQRRHHHHHHHHHHHQKHQKRVRDEAPRDETLDEPEEKRPKINPIFLWASQREQRIVEVRCEDYDKRNRIKLTKTAQGWRSIPRTTSNGYAIAEAAVCKKTTPGMADTSPASSVSSNDEKENGKQCLQEPANATASSLRCHPRMYSPNGTTNGLLTGEGAGRKKQAERRGYDEETNRRGYSSPLRARDEINDDEGGEKNGEEGKNHEQSKLKDRLSSLKNKDRLNGWINLQRLQMDKLFQPRVVLELLQLSQLPESTHQNIVHHTRNKDATASEAKRIEENSERDEENEESTVAEEDEEEREEEVDNEEVEEEANSEKSNRINKAGIQDILNMIDATASPVLATDTPSADLPVDSTKTYEVLDEEQSAEREQVKDTELDDMKDRTRSISSYETEAVDQDGEIDDKLEVHEEKILEDCCLQEVEDKKIRVEDNLGLLSMKNNAETTANSCKVAEADGGFVLDRPKCGSDSLVTWRPSIPTEEEEAPDEPGEPMKLDYDSSKILDALRNTPGLSVSVMRTHTPEIGKSPIAPPARPPSKASSSSRSPDSQAECVEKLLKNANDFGRDGSPRNLPGLSIVIPSYRYKSVSGQLTASPNTKHRVESPESTVSFNKADVYPEEMKVDGFPHEEDGDEEEDEDDCDSQVLEDLRQQKADSLAYDGIDADYYNGPGTRSNQDDRKTPLENTKSDHAWIGSGRNSEAQAKGKYQDLEHFDEQVLEELRSRGTVVSPQPSGIPCSPASRRPSSAYLERLLPSPPCSVSCSEDAKSELTLKSILASSSCADPRDYDKAKEIVPIRSDQSVDQPISRPVHSSIDRNVRRTNQRGFQERLNVHSQEARNSGRPMSSGDIHSTFYAERAAPKRPMSAEWQPATGQRQKSQVAYYQKTVSKTRGHFTDQDQIICSTSSSMDKFLDPARQLRELIETVGHLIPDPLLVPRDYLPGLAAAPATEIPKLLSSRPELRLPEALTRPDLLRDPDLLVISLAHLQHVLDHGEGPVARSRHSSPQQPRVALNGAVNKGLSGSTNGNGVRGSGLTRTIITGGRPKLSCKPICTLMPMQPIDLSNGGRTRVNPYSPLLRVRSGLLKQEPEVSSTASSPDESQLWHPLFGR